MDCLRELGIDTAVSNLRAMRKAERKANSNVSSLKSLRTQPRCILMPWYKGLVLWDLISVAFLAYTAAFLPFRLAFLKSSSDSVWQFSDPIGNFEFAVDVFFLLDIVRNFRTAYYDFYGDIVVDSWMICKNLSESSACTYQSTCHH